MIESDEAYDEVLADLYASRRRHRARLMVLDTDVASALLRRRTPDTLCRRLVGQVPAITFVTLGEFTTWTLVRRWARAVRPPCTPTFPASWFSSTTSTIAARKIIRSADSPRTGASRQQRFPSSQAWCGGAGL